MYENAQEYVRGESCSWETATETSGEIHHLPLQAVAASIKQSATIDHLLGRTAGAIIVAVENPNPL